MGNLIQYGYQGLDPGSKVRYLLNDMRCDKLSIAVATVRAHPDNYVLDAKNGNTLWADAISKETENVRAAFEVLPDGKSEPVDHQFVQCHMVLDINMKDFR